MLQIFWITMTGSGIIFIRIWIPGRPSVRMTTPSPVAPKINPIWLLSKARYQPHMSSISIAASYQMWNSKS